MMNAEQHQMAANPCTKPTDLSHKPACKQLETTPTITIYYYSVRKLILNLVIYKLHKIMDAL